MRPKSAKEAARLLLDRAADDGVSCADKPQFKDAELVNSVVLGGDAAA